MDQYPQGHEKELPHPPRWFRAIGVGIIVTGMAMGTGELVMWPHLATQYGLAILWFALVGITLQYFINQEIARSTLATGESFFTSSGRIIFWSPIFWFLSAILLYVWPGWSSTLGTILAELVGFGNYIVWAWVSLILVMILVFTGRHAYRVLEKTLKIIVPVFVAILIYISFFNLNAINLLAAVKGLLSFGYLPKDVNINVLLGAIVFAGAGGMLNLCTSLWYRDKQAGMAFHNGQITNPISGKPHSIGINGAYFAINQENLNKWRGWLRFIYIDQGIVFWFIGLLTLTLMSLNAFVVLSPLGIAPEGTNLAVYLSRIFASRLGDVGAKLYLIMAYLMLFSVMWTVIDALSRILSDIVYTNSREGRLTKLFAWGRRWDIHHLYYGIIFIAIILQAILLPFNQPLTFLLLSSVLGGFTMAIYTPLIIYHNNRQLPKELRPGLITNFVLSMATIFYGVFAILTIVNLF
ncbi:MAG: Nramp family divalent metal transporter [Candidatus Paceibacterota bacterium]|jgi:Mn2+/Fe2+ NRAMP family transporter